MAWINIESFLNQCRLLANNNPKLMISKVEYTRSNFVFYRKYGDNECAEFRICFVKNERKEEGFSIDYMRHTGKWQMLTTST